MHDIRDVVVRNYVSEKTVVHESKQHESFSKDLRNLTALSLGLFQSVERDSEKVCSF
jgi:hypothetical protein